jgi:hypothetical protein
MPYWQCDATSLRNLFAKRAAREPLSDSDRVRPVGNGCGSENKNVYDGYANQCPGEAVQCLQTQKLVNDRNTIYLVTVYCCGDEHNGTLLPAMRNVHWHRHGRMRIEI